MYQFSIIWQLSLEGTFVLFFHQAAEDKFFFPFFLFPLRPASTFLSTSSSPVGSFRSLQEARMRKSSESAFTSCSCPSASSSRRRTKAPRPSHRHRCVWACVKNQWQASLQLCHTCAWLCESECENVRHLMFSFSGAPVDAVVKGEKLAVIEFHAARGFGGRTGISVAGFP